MDGWSDFFVAQVGASAALAGLIFVGISINLERLIAVRTVLLRAAAALAMLVNVLAISSLLLMPDRSMRADGVQALAVAAVAWSVITHLGLRSIATVPPTYRTNAMVLFVLRQVATLPPIVGAVLLILRHESGMHWVAPAFVFAFALVIIEAWVTLVEIAR